MAKVRQVRSESPEVVVAAIPPELRGPTPRCRCVHCAGDCSAVPSAACERRTAARYAWLAERGVSPLDAIRARVAMDHPGLIREYEED